MVYQPSFREVAIMFLRRKAVFTVVFCAVCLAGGAYLLLKQPLYQSTASLVLHFDRQTVPNIDRTNNPTQLQGSNEHREILYSDADILRSPDIARAVIKGIGLERIYPRIAALKYPDGRKMDLAVRAFTSDFVVDVGLQSDVLNLNLFNPDPQIAHDAVQSVLDHFYAQEAAVFANPQLTFAEDEAKASLAKLTEAQNRLATFKAQHKIADLPQQVTQLLNSRTDVESRLGIAQGRLLEAQQKRDALKQLLDTVPPTITESAMGEQFHAADDVAARLDQLKAKRAELASTYLPGSAVFRQVDAQIESLSKAASMRDAQARSRSATKSNPVFESIKTDYLRASAESASAQQPADVLKAQLDQINKQLSQLEADRNEYDDLVRNVRIQNDTYRTLAIRYETARVEANRNAQKISAAVVISAPVVPHEPARPRKKLVALGTAIAALLLAAGSVLGLEAFDDRFRTAQEVTRVLRLPVLATFAQNS